MREEQPAESRSKTSRFADQNQPPKSRTNSTNPLKQRSSWGSNIVKGFSHDKKTKAQTTIIDKKPPLMSSDILNQKNTTVSSNSRVKRSLMGDLSYSVSSSQVHPLRRQSSGSRDLFNELDQLRSLLQESKEREIKLQEEISVLRRNPKVSDLEMELEAKKTEVHELKQRLESLESEKADFSEELSSLNLIMERNEGSDGKTAAGNLEMEVVELRRLNKELQMEKRNLACKVSSLESQLASFAEDNESEIVAKFKAEASMLRHTNEDLCKQVEGLQMSRLNEVEELAYLRWVNSCLRDELKNSCSSTNSEKVLSPRSAETIGEIVKSAPWKTNECLESSSGSGVKLIKKLKKWPITAEDLSTVECLDNALDNSWEHLEDGRSPRRRHSISGSNCCIDEMLPNERRQSDRFLSIKEMEKEAATPVSQNQDPDTVQRPHFLGSCQESNKLVTCFDVERRTQRIPNPPPRPSRSVSSGPKEEGSTQIPPPPPPPPPPPKFTARSSSGEVQRAPQVVEFYHSLMKRDSRRDSLSGGICEVPDVANVRSSMIGEIENRSSHLLAIKADVETQGEFVNSLIKEVNDAVYQNIEDVVAFVKWLDDELCFLVDERAVLKHFEWPEKKADTLREAAFGYRDLKNLETEVSYYKDDPRMPCDPALKKMVALSEKMERTVYNLQRNRDLLMHNCKQFQIPTDWMLDNGIVSKIKLGSVKLAKQYMKRVALELQSKAGLEKDPSMDYMLLQGVRFAFRIHQFAGGFDAETMHAFEELRNLANLLNKK